MSELTVFPKELLYKGLSVMILETPVCDFTRAWVDVVDFHMERVFGIFDCPALPELHTQKVEFHVSEILTCRGTLEWNIEHLYVSCSEKVISGEPIGYFYNAIIERPLHYGRVYYSISEINAKKSDIRLFDIPLSTVIKFDNGIIPYLKEFSYFGYLRNSKNGFEDMSHHDLDSQNIFTSAIQKAYSSPN